MLSRTKSLPFFAAGTIAVLYAFNLCVLVKFPVKRYSYSEKVYAMRYRILVSLMLITLCAQAFAQNAPDTSLDNAITSLRYEITAIPHRIRDNTGRVRAYGELVNISTGLIESYPDRSEPLTWKGIALSARARERGMSLSSLGDISQAKALLEKSIAMGPEASDGAATNALAMLYAKAPGWPLSFGNRRKAEELFEKALKISSNLDTNYRYGEFLIESGRQPDGLKHLKQALAFSGRPGRGEETLKKEEIENLIDRTAGKD